MMLAILFEILIRGRGLANIGDRVVFEEFLFLVLCDIFGERGIGEF